MNFEDYETLPTTSVSTHMTAGALAGVMEHCVMYPLDSVKVYKLSIQYFSFLLLHYMCDSFLVNWPCHNSLA